MSLHKPPADTSITSAQASAGDSLPWDREVCLGLIAQLWSLRQTMLARESQLQPELGSVLPQHHDSARNLIHYLSLRTVDLRPLQEQLAKLGL